MEMLRQLSATIPSLLFDSFAHGLHEQHVGDALVGEKPADSDVLFEMVDGRLHPGSRNCVTATTSAEVCRRGEFTGDADYSASLRSRSHRRQGNTARRVTLERGTPLALF
jgi:hypothetical protein